MMEAEKINLGCGNDILSGWINVDSSNLPGVDIVHNLEEIPLPFEDGSAEEILCQDILEHLEYPHVLRDIHRILAPGGTLRIRVPHFTSRNNFIDPTHRRLFSVDTFLFFVEGSEREYYFDFSFSKIEECRITFEKWSRWFFFNNLLFSLINRSVHRQRIYEATGLSRLFPAQNIEITLVK